MIPTACRRLLLTALAAILAAGCGAGGPGAVALEGVTLIDGTGAPPRPGTTVVFKDGRIEAVGADLSLAPGTERRDLTGHTLLPGLIDMHAHIAIGPIEIGERDGLPMMRLLYDEEVSRRLARELPRWGITTIRNPAGPTSEAVALREAIDSGALPGPRVITAGAVIDQTVFEGLGATVTTPEEVTAEIARQAEAGVDLIKLYASLTPPLLMAGIEAAHAHRLPVLGHLWLTDWKAATELGIDGITHALPMSHTLLPPDRAGAFLESIHRLLAEGSHGTQAMYRWFEHADLDGSKMRELYAAMAERGVHLDPTLVAIESMFFANTPHVTANPELEAVPRKLLDNWRGGFSLTMGWSEEDFDRAQAVFPRVLELTRRLHDAGVTLTAGSDLSMPWLAPGASLHRELELLVQAGIPPLQVLSIATRNAARALGRLDELGTIEPGKRADLVVLDADPLADIRNTRRITHVFQDGVEVSRD